MAREKGEIKNQKRFYDASYNSATAVASSVVKYTPMSKILMIQGNQTCKAILLLLKIKEGGLVSTLPNLQLLTKNEFNTFLCTIIF